MFVIYVYMQSICLQFINALICYPDDIDFRIHLRNEFVRHGLMEVVEVISYTRGHFWLHHPQIYFCYIILQIMLVDGSRCFVAEMSSVSST